MAERPRPTPAPRAEQHPAVRQARRAARLLDESFRVPGTDFRVGVDGLVGLIPVVGDAIGAALSATVVVIAARAGVPLPVLLRMIGNVLLEFAVGAIPVLGDAFDFVFKANRRNADLLEKAIADPDGSARGSTGLIVGIGLGAVLLLAGIGYGVYALLAAMLGALAGAG